MKNTRHKPPPTNIWPKLPAFTSEILLQQAIAGLLSRMPDIIGVEILQGAQEYGKDIIFRTTGPLGDTLTCACVIKKSKITGKVSENAGARTVLHQAEQALDTPFTDGTGREIWIDRVYVISTKTISQTAMNSIRGRLEHRKGQIVFIGGARLFELFRTHWLDFLSDEYGTLEAHLAEIKDLPAQSELRNVAARYGLGEMSQEDARIYVSRLLGRKLPSYRYRPLAKSLLPTVEDLSKEIGRRRVRQILSGFSLLSSTLRHVHSWGLLYEKGCEGLSSFAGRLEALAESIEKQWLKSAAASLGGRRLRLADVPDEKVVEERRKKVVEVDGKKVTEVTKRQKMVNVWRIQDVDPIEEALICASSLCEEGLAPLQVAFNLSQRMAGTHKGVDAITDPPWRLVSTVTDCLDRIPFPPCEAQSSGAECQFSEEQLRQNRNRSLLIVGAAGLGKTSFCRWNALVDAEALMENVSEILPVYVPLHSLGNVALNSFDEVFLRSAGRSGLLGVDGALRAQTIRLYLDGLDEVPTDKQRIEIVQLARKGLEQKGDLQVILTARDYIEGPWLKWLPRFELLPLTAQQVEELEERWLGSSEALLRDFRQQVVGTALEALMRVPLLATLTLLVFRQTRRLPENRARLYTTFIDLLTGGWDIAKSIVRPSDYGRVFKITILAGVAEAVHSKGRRYFSESLLEQIVTPVLRGTPEISLPRLLDELIADSVISRSGDDLFFSHHSFQEYLTAKRYLGEPQGKGITRALGRFLKGEDWWREVLRFYIGLSENPQEISRWLLGNFDRYGAERPVADNVLGWLQEAFPGFNVERQFAVRG